MSSQSPVTDVFDAAKAIVETLKDLDRQLQIQAIRFASETLGINLTLFGQQSAPPTPVNSSATPPPPPSGAGQVHSTNIKQFTAAKDPKSDQQFAAVVAYFYRFEAPESQRRDTIDGEALRDAARLVGRRRPTKPNMTLTNAKNAGYLDAVRDGNFRINSVGENLVAVTLPGTESEGPARRGARKKKVAKKTGRATRRTKRAE